MASTTFTSGTVITSEWLNAIDIDVYGVEHYGAVGDGVTDDTAAILAAMAANTTVMFRSGATYLHTPISTNLSINLKTTGPAPATLYCPTNTSTSNFSVTGTLKGATTLTADAVTGAIKLNVSSIANISVGDLLKIQSTVLWPNDNRGTLYEGQMVRVKYINGTELELYEALTVGLRNGDVVTSYTPVTVNINNIIFKRDTPTGSSRGVGIQYDVGGVISNCSVQNCSRTGLQIANSWHTKVLNSYFEKANLAVSEQLGYGVAVVECIGVELIQNTAKECRRGFDVTGNSIPSVNCRVLNNTIYGGGICEDGTTAFWPVGSVANTGIGTHGGADNTVFAGNRVFDSYYGAVVRGRTDIYTNNVISGPCVYPFILIWGSGTVITDNIYEDNVERYTNTPFKVYDNTYAKRPTHFIQFNTSGYDSQTQFIAKNNIAKNVTTGFILFDSTSGATVNNFDIQNNTITAVASSAGTVALLDSAVNVYLNNCIIINNDIHVPATYEFILFRNIQLNRLNTLVTHTLDVNQYRVTIPNDSVVKLPVKYNTGQIHVLAFPYGTVTTPRTNTIIRNASTTNVDLGGSSGITISNVALSGTTGGGGAVTMSFVNSFVYLENRSGSDISLIVKVTI